MACDSTFDQDCLKPTLSLILNNENLVMVKFQLFEPVKNNAAFICLSLKGSIYAATTWPVILYRSQSCLLQH